MSSCGTGGRSLLLLFFVLLKAARMEANEGFLVNAEPALLTDGCEKCPKVALRLAAKPFVVAELAESIEVEECALEWEKLCSPPKVACGLDGSQPEPAPPKPPPPKPNPAPERPNNVGVDPAFPSSKSYDNANE